MTPTINDFRQNIKDGFYDRNRALDIIQEVSCLSRRRAIALLDGQIKLVKSDENR